MWSSANPRPRRRSLGILVGSVALFAPAEVTACGEDCGPGSCDLPVVVELPPEAIPPDASPRLCVDNACSDLVEEPMLNRFGWSGGWSGDDDVDVRLEFVDAAEVTVGTFEGSGTLSGDCCKTLLLRLSDDGESLIEA